MSTPAVCRNSKPYGDGLRHPLQIAPVHRQINVARHPRGQRIFLRDMQEYGDPAHYTVFNAAGTQSGGNRST